MSSESKKAVRGNHEPNSNAEPHGNNLGKVTACRCQSFVVNATNQRKNGLAGTSAQSAGNTCALTATGHSHQVRITVHATCASEEARLQPHHHRVGRLRYIRNRRNPLTRGPDTSAPTPTATWPLTLHTDIVRIAISTVRCYP